MGTWGYIPYKSSHDTNYNNWLGLHFVQLLVVSENPIWTIVVKLDPFPNVEVRIK